MELKDKCFCDFIGCRKHKINAFYIMHDGYNYLCSQPNASWCLYLTKDGKYQNKITFLDAIDIKEDIQVIAALVKHNKQWKIKPSRRNI